VYRIELISKLANVDYRKTTKEYSNIEKSPK
jgi:hypothetical protein